MLKAYDRIEWNFLRVMLIRVRFSSHWVTLIMNYVESVTYSLLINGDQVGYITPGRGLRQGDPLSPYVFIICMEGLISLLKEACSAGELQGIKVGPSVDPMTHLMFVGDTLLLGCATLSETAKFKSILDTYKSWSGQLVNAQKSTLLFSPNVSGTTRATILEILGMTEVNSHGKYLGLSTTIGSSKKEVFSNIIDRVEAKVVNWKPRLLSTAAKEAWKLITEPNSPLSQVYKDRYFPRTSFWAAELGPKLSYTWPSILSVRDLICKGIEWKLASGSNIREDFHDITVADLIDSEIDLWKINFVRSLFYSIDSDAILQIPLSKLDGTDSLLWTNSRYGIFTVKSAYQLAYKQNQSMQGNASSSSSGQKFFSQIWTNKIPRRIGHFLFEALHNRLPTTDNIIKRQV
ncbi:hypothetical protein LIER_24143 [Lithospermum erythrorhizon]|uniref:Reverse transcriptase domain-containing protein n=1 Tax=Lithospermum erythrorhizon TaxID=34254 RepID=A0AAV3R336_LITER